MIWNRNSNSNFILLFLEPQCSVQLSNRKEDHDDDDINDNVNPNCENIPGPDLNEQS